MTTVINGFLNYLRDEQPQKILEVGTLRSNPDVPTHHKAWAPEADWTFADVEMGIDVDVVSDVHHLKEFEDDSFDAFVSASVWEHLERPWIAAEAVFRVVKPGGAIYLATHQTFPLHGYPHDFFRFSREALDLIFTDAGFDVRGTGYDFPCTIRPPAEVKAWNGAAESYLNVNIFAVKP